MAPLEAKRDVLRERRFLASLRTSRVEPRESNSRPVFGRVFVLTPSVLTDTSPIFRLKFVGKWGRQGGGKEIAMTKDGTTITHQLLGGTC
jgi:hypothetical protein